jgi:hypothetical protein
VNVQAIASDVLGRSCEIIQAGVAVGIVARFEVLRPVAIIIAVVGGATVIIIIPAIIINSGAIVVGVGTGSLAGRRVRVGTDSSRRCRRRVSAVPRNPRASITGRGVLKPPPVFSLMLIYPVVPTQM